MMFRTVIVLLVISVGHSLYAQQQVLNHISNEYISSSNELKTVSGVNQLRNTIYKKQFGENHPYQTEEIDDRSAYYKIHYKKNSSTTEEGLVNIWYIKNKGLNINIEDHVNKFFTIYLMDYDKNDYTKEFVKTSAVHGGFFFNKKKNNIYIYIHSQPERDFVSAEIEINLTPEEKIAFAKDFILKTKFK